tara:strand:- start:1191 stop:1430 length:240 start_codon:yes stop_codon:yes gene_type:complete
MMFILAFVLIAGLEISYANDDSSPELPVVETPEEPDVCVGCNSVEEEKEEPIQPPLVLEVRIDPVTGKVEYIIRNIVIE